jgi:hypothetical protein
MITHDGPAGLLHCGISIRSVPRHVGLGVKTRIPHERSHVRFHRVQTRSVGLARAAPVHVRPARSIFSSALNFRRSAIAALVSSPWGYCPFRSPGGPPLPLASPCNRQRPFFVAGDRHGFPLLVRAPHLAILGISSSRHTEICRFVKRDSWGGMFQSAGLPWRDVLGSNCMKWP